MLYGAFQASSWQCNLVADGQPAHARLAHVFFEFKYKLYMQSGGVFFQGLASLVSMAMAELYIQKISL